MNALLKEKAKDKVDQVLGIYKRSGIDEWAKALKEKYLNEALNHLDDVAVLSKRKEPLYKLALQIIEREVNQCANMLVC